MRGQPPVPRHEDPGLQPERTVLSWGRTVLALFTAALVFLRWLPQYGPWILVLVGAAGAVALAIYLTQRRRYSVRVMGIAAERFHADVGAVLWVSGSVLLIGVLGLGVLLSI
ncbi:uncharacterized membrane protein YidH (DUF202 family) [Arthrobacter sp. UYP6]|uniref:DUF202 domain-containing protein n=1 Tax=Arthrobacter sp. UYP6 TaxID=1756378 RepID=UPI003391F739